MKWSWKAGRLAGIDLYIHTTFLLLLVWVGAMHWMAEQSIAAVLGGLAFILAVFASVVLHELGHALTARRFGIPTRDITLLPIGGVARLERMPEDPKQELAVALAGPAVTFVIAAVLFLWNSVVSGWMPLERLTTASGPFLERLFYANAILLGFNLLPAFPMDGGRVLRALLASRMDYVKATKIAGQLGQLLAFAFGFIGLFTNPFLVFIALFVWIGAAQETAMVEFKSAFTGIPVRSAMLTDFRVLEASDELTVAIDRILEGSQQDFPVTENGHLAGILTRSDLLVALSNKGTHSRVGEVMRREFVTAESSDMVDRVFERLQRKDLQTIPVLQFGRLVGLLTTENVNEFFMIRAAVGQGHTVEPPLSNLAFRN